MSEAGSTVVGASPARAIRFAWPAISIVTARGELLAIALLCPILLSAAIWNGFPIVFYDTGAYMLQGLGHVFLAERSPVYSLFLEPAGARFSLWFVAIIQCAITAFLMTELARAIRPTLSVWSLIAIGAVLTVATGLPWYAAQIEPDCFVATMAIGIYLLTFCDSALSPLRLVLVVLTTALSTAVHPSHAGIAVGLVVVIALTQLPPIRRVLGATFPQAKLALASLSVVLALATVLACNYGFTRHIFFSRSGAIFLAARLMEDGLVKPVLDETCPQSGYAMCPYKDQLPSRADTWLWMSNVSPFHKLGGFSGMEKESASIVAQSIMRYPLSNLGYALGNGILQFFWFQTGDGIVPQEWVLNREFKIALPQQLKAYDHAYQQEGDIWFLPINLVHVPVAILSLAGLYLLLREARRARDWRKGLLPAFVLLALLGNAFVCGVFSGPHGRYQSRMMWLPTFAIALVAWPLIEQEIGQRIRRRKALA
jgi:hypothetical protein